MEKDLEGLDAIEELEDEDITGGGGHEEEVVICEAEIFKVIGGKGLGGTCVG